jgi:ADP-ribose pyrophosphatase
MTFSSLNRHFVYRGKVFNIVQEQVRTPEKRVVSLDIVEHRGAVTIVPLDDAGNIWFVRQYRHPAGRTLLELPAGVMESAEDSQSSAERELREEIGMAARQFQKIGEFFLAPGYSTEYMTVYLASGLYADPLPQDEDELLSVEIVPVEIAYQMAHQGEIADAKSLAALFLAQDWIKNR